MGIFFNEDIYVGVMNLIKLLLDERARNLDY